MFAFSLVFIQHNLLVMAYLYVVYYGCNVGYDIKMQKGYQIQHRKEDNAF